jgi:tetratricopeptide (TPR) repeat protein
MYLEPNGAPPLAFSNGHNDSLRAHREATAGDALIAQGEYNAARHHYAQAIALQPHEAKFHWMLAVCDGQLGEHDSAGQHLHDAVRLDPGFAPAHATLAQWYLIHGMVEQALDASATALRLAPDNSNVIATRSGALEESGELDAAWELIRNLPDDSFTSLELVLQYARLARGRGQEATALGRIDQQLRAAQTPAAARSTLHLYAAGLLEDLGHYDDAFANASHGNSLRAPPYDPMGHQQAFDRLIEYFSRLRLRSLPRNTYRSEKPVFIIGMPRSGTSLVEQILASHPQVHGAGELDFMDRVFAGTLQMLSANEAEFPQCLNSLSVDEADGMAQIYLAPLNLLSHTATRVTDKMPLNFIHLGLISILLPQARIIHCQRDPLDTCLSCYMTAFTAGHDFKYNLRHLGLFYRQYERLMSHWKQVMEMPILDVKYENLIADPEGQSRQLIDFIGLPWDDRCLDFHKTRRSVSTASTRQVRKPIYRSSIQRWRHYEKHLGPLKAALGIAH